MARLRRIPSIPSLLLPMLLVGGAASAAQQTFTVDTTADSGTGSLRWAIQQANGNGNPSDTDLITFDISGSTPHRITPSSELPAATESVAVDATQEPDYAGTPVVVLDGSSAPGDAHGLEIQGDDGRVFGLSIVHFGSSGLVVKGSVNWIGFCWLGLDADESAAGNYTGLELQGNDNYVGTSSAFLLGKSRNVLSANEVYGLRVVGGEGNSIRNNLIGLGPTSTTGLGNGGSGIAIYSAGNNVVGGTAADAANYISGNGSMGIRIRERTSLGNRVVGNEIGFTPTGGTLANTHDAVRIDLEASDNEVGDVTSGAANRITTGNGSEQDAVSVAGSLTRLNTIRGNAMVHAGDQGIDLGDDGVTVNDLGDADRHPNEQQNHPTFVTSPSYAPSTDDLTVTYSVGSSDPSNASYPLTVDFYRADPDGKAGEAWLGQDEYDSSDYAGGAVTTTFTPAASVSGDGSDWILATATDLNGNTSEFGAPVNLPEGPRGLLAAGALAALAGLASGRRGRGAAQPAACASSASQRR